MPLYKLHIDGTTYGKSILMGSSSASTSALYNGFSAINRPSLMKLGLKIGSQPEELLFNFTGDGTFEINNKLGPAIIVKSSSGSKIMQLEDDGLLRARGVRVDEDNWPDYVFTSNYELPSLSFVKEYISLNKHLPGIPSAKEIEASGLDLGEVTKLQMEKIEELTLYAIKQDERIQELESRLRELEKILK